MEAFYIQDRGHGTADRHNRTAKASLKKPG